MRLTEKSYELALAAKAAGFKVANVERVNKRQSGTVYNIIATGKTPEDLAGGKTAIFIDFLISLHREAKL